MIRKASKKPIGEESANQQILRFSHRFAASLIASPKKKHLSWKRCALYFAITAEQHFEILKFTSACTQGTWKNRWWQSANQQRAPRAWSLRSSQSSDYNEHQELWFVRFKWIQASVAFHQMLYNHVLTSHRISQSPNSCRTCLQWASNEPSAGSSLHLGCSTPSPSTPQGVRKHCGSKLGGRAMGFAAQQGEPTRTSKLTVRFTVKTVYVTMCQSCQQAVGHQLVACGESVV